jgi:hypothetical protein
MFSYRILSCSNLLIISAASRTKSFKKKYYGERNANRFCQQLKVKELAVLKTIYEKF